MSVFVVDLFSAYHRPCVRVLRVCRLIGNDQEKSGDSDSDDNMTSHNDDGAVKSKKRKMESSVTHEKPAAESTSP